MRFAYGRPHATLAYPDARARGAMCVSIGHMLTSNARTQATDIFKRLLLEHRDDLALNVYARSWRYAFPCGPPIGPVRTPLRPRRFIRRVGRPLYMGLFPCVRARAAIFISRMFAPMRYMRIPAAICISCMRAPIRRMRIPTAGTWPCATTSSTTTTCPSRSSLCTCRCGRIAMCSRKWSYAYPNARAWLCACANTYPIVPPVALGLRGRDQPEGKWALQCSRNENVLMQMLRRRRATTSGCTTVRPRRRN